MGRFSSLKGELPSLKDALLSIKEGISSGHSSGMSAYFLRMVIQDSAIH
ncbi:MAG: hypothetical protein ACK2U3_00570 [Anaerolineales bacterium]